MRYGILLAWCWLVLGGCDESSVTDAGPDAASRADAGGDAGTSDAGTSDAGTSDGGTSDGGTSDAGTSDAGTSDAGADGGSPACGTPLPFDVGARYTRTLHVATDGDDDAAGSAAAPLRTLNAAARMATPGTEVIVHEGTYGAAQLGVVQGTAEEPIRFAARGEVVIDASSGIGWAMSDAQYVVVEGFTIRDAAIHGMNLDDGGSYETPAHHLVLRDITVRDAGSGGNNDCIKMSGVDDFWVLDGDVSGCDRGELIDMVGCHRGVIAHNRFHSPVGNGVQAKGGSSDVLIRANRFFDIPGRAVNAGGSTGLAFFRPLDAPHEAARIRVEANVFERVGAESGAPVAFVGCDACVFVQNTVVEPRTWMFRILQESTDPRFVPSRNGVFANNLVVFRTADIRTYANVGGNTSPESFTVDYNLWFATDDATFSGPSFPGSIPAAMHDVVQMDPGFASADDYHIDASSPARGGGTPRALHGDFDGRCFADPPSLGAFEAR